MTETIPQAAGGLAAIAEPEHARSVLCPLCWARAGRPCTLTGPAGDHLARWLEAERRGVITRGQLAAVVTGLEVIASHVIVWGGARWSGSPCPTPRCRPG